MPATIWLIPLLPLAGALINLFFGKRLGGYAGWLASATVGLAFAISVGAFFALIRLPEEGRELTATAYEWITSGSFHVAIEILIDPLSMTMLLVVTGVGFLIHVYSNGYMKDDPRFGRFFAYMNLFVFFMLVLVMADNYLLMYVGWEGVGLCSYLLIGFWFEKEAASNAAKKAFIVTRIGDTLMLIGLALVVFQFGSLAFGDVLTVGGVSGVSEGTMTVIAVLLFCGAVGKSAQLPLHVWLPDAMEGPTPVSALIHAATMVTAGVYLVVRSHVLFTPTAMTVVALIGLASALYGALSSIGQDDIKRALAYSTMSQLGYMFFAAGLGAYNLAIALLVVHAFYKSLMFLGSGSVMHGLGGHVTDMKVMGGLRRLMPATGAMFVIGAWALSGLPPMSGFFAKDPIISYANETGHVLMWILAIAAAFFSALYISRILFLTFFGPYRGDGHPHESPAAMVLPMGILAVGAAFGGLLTLSANGALEHFLEPATGVLHEAHEGLAEPLLIAISIVVALAGVLTAWLVWGSGRVDWVVLRERNLPTHEMFAHGFYINDAYANLLVPSLVAGSRFLASGIDGRVVDGAVNGLGRLTERTGGLMRHLQTGIVRTYALAILVGVVGLLLVLEVMR